MKAFDMDNQVLMTVEETAGMPNVKIRSFQYVRRHEKKGGRNMSPLP